MKHTITETKIRSIVRKELQSYLIQEGFMDKVKQQLSTLKNLGIDPNTLKSLAKTSITNPQGLAAQAKDAVDVATNTPEYREINTILSGINIGSTQLSQAYNLVYSKSKANKNVYTFAKTPQDKKEKIIGEYTSLYRNNSDFFKKLIEYFDSITTAQKNTIKSPMQERKINEAADGISVKDQLIGIINQQYTNSNTRLKDLTSQKTTYEGLLEQNILSIFVFILQVLNELVTNPLQHQPTKIVESIKTLYATMTRHLGVLKTKTPEQTPAEPAASTQPAAEPAAT